MPSFKCGMCGELMDVPDTAPTVKCPHCGTVQAVVRGNPNENEADNSGNHDVDSERSASWGTTRSMKIIIATAVVFVVAILVVYQAMVSRGRNGTNAGIVTIPAEVMPPALRQQADKDRSETVGWYLEAANDGNVEAQYGLGEMYYTGEGVVRDVKEAAKWYRIAAEHDHVGAQNKLGNAFYNGWGVEKNYKEAARWYRKAALRGNAEAQTALGNMFYNGTGVNKSYANAVWWYNLAANQGNAWAQYYLGNMYRNGLGVPKNIRQARELYRKAMQQGHLGAMGAYEHIKHLE